MPLIRSSQRSALLVASILDFINRFLYLLRFIGDRR